MRISTKGRYALMVLLDLAVNAREKTVSLRSVAERQGISEKYLEGIVARLGAADLVISIRGKYGGYKLAKEPKDPDEVINQQTVGFWAGLQNYIHDYLRSVSLEDILNGTYAKLDNKFDHWDGSI